MADNRNIRYSGQPPGFGMMQGSPQFVQPGMPGIPMMHQQRMMMPQAQMMVPGMFPVAMGVRGPGVAPPPYTQQLASNYQTRQNRSLPRASRSGGHGMKTEEELKKEKQFQIQQQRLKQFGKAAPGGLDPNKLVDSIFGETKKPASKPVVSKMGPEMVNLPSDDAFGEFLGGPSLDTAQSSLPTSSSTNQSLMANQNIAQNNLANPNISPNNLTNQNALQTNQALPGAGSSNQNMVSGVNQPITSRPEPGTHNIDSNKVQSKEKKDIMEMMLNCSDLSAPAKAKPFHKPALRELHPVHHENAIEHHESVASRKWDSYQTFELSDLFLAEAKKDQENMPVHQPPPRKVSKQHSPTSKHPPKPPIWLDDDNVVPEIYKQVLEASLVDGKISTERLSPILTLSGLPRELLAHLWGLANKVTPGQLIKSELYAILAMVALVQNNFQVTSTDILSRCPHPPVPFLGQQRTPSAAVGPGNQQTTPVEGQQVDQSVPGNQPVTPPVIAQNQSVHPLAGSHSSGQVATPVAGIQGNQTFTAPVSHVSSPQQPTNVASTPGLSHTNQIPHVPLNAGPPKGDNSPATLPVTQLPSSVAPQGMVTTSTEEDDFADFQSAPPAQPTQGDFGSFLQAVRTEKSSPVKDDTKYLYSVPKPDDEAIAAHMSPDMKHSSVRNFFGSDESSEGGNSLEDDEYFDGYKSPDSKPSDSTSQFSTDQSENEDFKNFENYLDEFNKKKQELDKDSPLHRPISRMSPIKQPSSPVKVLNQSASVPTLPAPWQQGQSKGALPWQPTQSNTQDEEFGDFAAFQSSSDKTKPDMPAIQSEPTIKKSSDFSLIGDEDKYAALRVVDLVPESGNTFQVDSVKVGVGEDQKEEEENWADFQAAGSEISDSSVITSNTKEPENISKKDAVLGLFDSGSHGNRTEESDWSGFSGSSAQKDGTDSDWAAFADAGGSKTGDGSLASQTQQTSGSFIEQNFFKASNDGDSLNKSQEEDDWADFQSSGGSTISANDSFRSNQEDTTPGGLVNIKKDNLGKNEILNLFKVKHEPLKPLPGFDNDNGESKNQKDNEEHVVSGNLKTNQSDDFGEFKSTVDSNQLGSPMSDVFSSSHSDIPQTSPANISQPTERKHSKRRSRSSSHGSDSHEDMFRMPPPMDDFPEDEDEFGGFSRGYDLEHIDKPQPPPEQERKHLYGLYGINSAFVGPQSKTATTANKNRTDPFEKDSETDKVSNDSDSGSCRDLDSLKDISVVNMEDSQSVASLEFFKGRVRDLKDAENADTQSVSSSDSGNFDNQFHQSRIPDSKSLDSLDLKKSESGVDIEEAGEEEEGDKTDMEKRNENMENEVSSLPQYGGIPSTDINIPVLGDRYSGILPDIPGSDKHAHEWQRCLEQCCQMIKDANNIFNSISSSAVCNEVMKSTHGSEYVQGVIEIYRVVCKISLSRKKMAISSDRLEQLLKDIDLAWNNLTAFLAGGSSMPDTKSLDFKHAVLMSDDTTAQYKACGVCLLDVDAKSKGKGQEDNAKLTYGGRQYHAPCANFWVNCVDSMLPALKLPELL